MIKFLRRRGLAKFVGLLAVALVSGQGFAQKPDAQQATTLFTNVRIFDGKSPTLSEPVNVLVRGNLIEKISTIGPPRTATRAGPSSTAGAAL